MWKCPICGNSTNGSFICPQCGFDESADREVYPTLLCSEHIQQAKSALKSVMQQAQEETQSDPKDFVIEGTVLKKYYGTDTSIRVPAEVTVIGESCFLDCASLRKIVIPAGVIEISDSAFENCGALQEVRFPEELKWIGERAFKNCTSLRKIVIPAGVKKIVEWAFVGCTALQEITLLSANTVIGKTAFVGCPGTVKRAGTPAIEPEERIRNLNEYMRNVELMGFQIRNNVLEKYTGIEPEVRIPWWVKEIGPKAFAYDQTITSVTLSEGVLRIGKDAFVGCGRLKEVDFPSGLQEIGESAFYGCKSLERVWLYKERPREFVLKMGALAFAGCTALKEVRLPKEMREIPEYAFGQCENLEWLKFDDEGDMEHIAKGAFKGCKSLVNLMLPAALCRIDDEAFAGCTGLESILLPNSIQSVGEHTFDDCENLKQIWVPEKKQKLLENTFPNDPRIKCYSC